MDSRIDKNVLLRYVNGEFTDEDKIYIESVFRDESYQSELQKYLSAEWLELCKQDNLEVHDLDHILHKLYYNINHQKTSPKKGILVSLWRTYLRVAAVLLFPLALAYSLYFPKEIIQFEQVDEEVSYAEIHTPLGSRTSFSLPDQSTGWLNGGSTLRYPVKFSDSRDVELTGEAYFDVKKNKNKPFNVKAANVTISVLGTKFNVAAYSDDKNVDVVLESGKVRLYDINHQEFVEMDPNERVLYKKNEQKVLSKSIVNTKKYSSWKEGKLVFRNDPIEEVAKRLGRWYNTDIVVNLTANTKNANFRLRATFEDEEIEEVMRLLKLTFPIDYQFEKRQKNSAGEFEKRKLIINVK